MVFSTGLIAPEGPVALPDGTWVMVEGGAERGCVTHISADGQTKQIIKKTGRPNGLAMDADGVIWAAESKTPSLMRLTMDRKAEVVATGCDGEPFLFPNDLSFGPDGGLYLTDSGVFIDNFPDGMAFSTDGRLYVAVFGQRDVTVLGTKGEVVERIATVGKLPTNVAFALPGRKRIDVTEYEFGQLEAFDVAADGLPLWTGPSARAGATA